MDEKKLTPEEEGRPYSPDEISKKMPESIGKKYRVKGHPVHGNVPGLAFTKGKFGYVDFRTLTLAQAAELVKAGFPYLELLNTKEDAPAGK